MKVGIVAAFMVVVLVISTIHFPAFAVSIEWLPQMLAINPNNNMVYVIGGAGEPNYYLGAINGTTNKLVATAHLNLMPLAVGVNESDNTIWVKVCEDIFCSNGSTSEVFDPNSLTLLKTYSYFPFNPSCDYSIYDNVNGYYYIVGAGGQVTGNFSIAFSVIAWNNATNQTTLIYTGHMGTCITLNPTTNTLYVTNMFGASVSIIDGNTNTVTAIVPVGDGPLGIAVNPKTGIVYVANQYGGSVSVIDGRTNNVIDTIFMTIVNTSSSSTTTTSSTSASSTSTSRTTSTSSITSTTATSTKSASTSSTSSTSASIPASHGSYIRTYYSGLFWHPKIAEIHISATDALSSGTLTYVLVVQLLSGSGEAVAQSLPVAGDLFGKVFGAIQEAVGGNPDGSFDFTAMEIARGIGWLYGGSFSEGTIKRVPISFFPIPIPLFNLDTPGYYPLSFTNDQFTGLISSALAVSYNIVNLYDPQGRLYLWVTDGLGRQTGFSANASQPFNEIPGSSYVEYNGNMAVILPGNVTRFTYYIDASKATLPTENYTLSISSVSDGRITSAKSTQEAILAGQIQSSSVTVTVTETTTASLSSTYPGGPAATNIPTDYIPYLMLSVAIVVASVIIGMAIRRKTAPEGPPSRV